MSKKSAGKRYKAVRGDLSEPQQHALLEWQKTYQKAHPLILETQSVAKRLWQELLSADEWRISETVVPEHRKEDIEALPDERWSVGHAKVNFVDHIDVQGDGDD